MPRLAPLALNAYVTRRSPISLVHFVTERCNARCSHCFLDFSQPERSRDELSSGEVEQLARHLGAALVNVNLTGGEPFLRPDLWAISAAYLARARVASLYITTNGSLPGRLARYLDQYRASPWRANIQVSISIDDFPAAHDQNRRIEDGYGLALESYRLCAGAREIGVTPNIALTITPQNHARVLALYAHLRDECAVASFTVSAMREAGVAPTMSDADRRVVGAAYGALTRQIAADRRSGTIEGYGRSVFGGVLDAKNDLLHGMLSRTYAQRGAGHPPCPAGRLFVVIRANGDVEACEMLSDVRLGNLRDSGYRLDALLAGPAARAVRRRIAETGCHCTYECALGVSLISRLRYVPTLLRGAWRGFRHGR